MTYCHHADWEDTWPKFEQINTTDREGRPVVIPRLVDQPYDPHMPLAVQRRFTPQNCPICQGADVCPDCGERLEPPNPTG
jgi:hypothetical protein